MTMSPPAVHEYPKNKWTIALAITFGTLMGTIDTSIVNVALPHLRGTLSATVEEITWISTGYVVASVIVMPLTAFLGARFGRKRVYMAGLVLFLLGSFFCGAARTLPALVVFRILQGLGAGVLQPTEQAILRETFPPEEQGRAMALFGFAIMIGPAIGPTLGGWIVDNYSWPWIFYINLPVGAVGLLSVWRVVHDPPYLERSTGKIDWWGIGLLVLGLAAVQTLLEQGEKNDWFDSRLNVAYAVVGAAALALFVATELEVENPAVNLRTLRDRSFSSGTAIGAVLGAVLFSTLFLLPIYMQELLRFDAMQTGLALLPRSLTMFIAIPIVGMIYNRISPRFMVAFGLALGGVTCIQMSRFTLDSGTADILMPQMVQGVALACIFIPLSTVALVRIERRQMSEATGLNNLVRQLGGSFGVAIFASQLGRYSAQARSTLVAHVAASDPSVAARLHGMKAALALRSDAVTAQAQALRIIDLQVTGQAAMLGFERAFQLAAVLFFVSVPLVLLLDEGRKKGARAEEHGEHVAIEI